MTETRQVDVYWTVQDGKRWSVALTDADAWASLKRLWAYEENPHGWSVEQSREIVPVAIGEVIEGAGEAIELDDDGHELSRRAYKPVHVFWHCPHCSKRHNTDLFSDPIEQSFPSSNPSIWFCESGHGLVLVRW